MNMYGRFSAFFVGVVFLFVSLFGVGARIARAEGLPGFGGKIVSVITCPCSMNLMITIAGVKGGTFSFGPGSVPFAWYQIYRPGPWAKGTYSPGGMCLWFIPFGCAGIPTMGTMLEVGTSMI